MLTEYVIDTRLDGPNLTGKLERHAAHDRVYARGNPTYSQIIAWPVERFKKNTRLAG